MNYISFENSSNIFVNEYKQIKEIIEEIVQEKISKKIYKLQIDIKKLQLVLIIKNFRKEKYKK